ncbi:MAG: hypothetical protein RL662_174 [Bacteroidota bacterium]|jgi:hypothetical protein
MKQIIVGLFCLISLNSWTQQYRSPLDISLELSANCGELRNNHFHSGIDIKTQGAINKPIFSIESGYVSRISISPAGYGLALYIDHPSTGHTSVYGHLESFPPRIAAYIKEKQYDQESFRVDLKLKPSELPVKKGELVAYSGNTGGSGGPHLHFEIRDSKTEKVLDPLVYYKNMIADTRSPEIRGLAVYPVAGRGVVNGSLHPLRQAVSLSKSGSYTSPKQAIRGWGIIGLGLKAYDRMNGTSNVYGVKKLTMRVDGRQMFRHNIESFSFDQTRMLNTFTDFADWRLNNSFYMYSFVEPGNALPFYTTENNGYLNINEERAYNISYELEDIYGNNINYQFEIIGEKQNIPTPSPCSLVMVWDDENRYISEPFSLIIPRGNLYNNVCFTLAQTSGSEFYSNIFTVNNTPVPLHKSGEVQIKMKSDPLKNKKQYGLVEIKNGKPSWIGGKYKGGVIIASIRELGCRLTVSADTESPVITAIATTQMTKKGKKKIVTQVKSNSIKLRVTDNLSGISSFRGTVDGKFALFTHDVKSPVYTYTMDASRIEKGKTHTLVFTATDACGNETKYTKEFEF